MRGLAEGDHSLGSCDFELAWAPAQSSKTLRALMPVNGSIIEGATSLMTRTFLIARLVIGPGAIANGDRVLPQSLVALPANFFAMGQKATSLFDNFVGATEQREWYGDAKPFGRLQIYDKLDSGRLLDRKVRRFGAFQYPPV